MPASVVLNFLGIRSTSKALTVVCLLLFMGAMGKSAQFLLHTWLPDAMEGPTPVSALIHAATMVTAGVFLVARLSPLFELSHTALIVVTFIGAITAFFAATVGLVQNDIKRVIAYSTCSQLGYMFVALGHRRLWRGDLPPLHTRLLQGAAVPGAGSVIHAVSDEQDMRNMGGLRTLIPQDLLDDDDRHAGADRASAFRERSSAPPASSPRTRSSSAAYASHSPVAGYAFILLVIAAIFTSFYSWRLIFMTFHGKPRASHDVMHHVHELPNVMLVPLFILAAGALFAGVHVPRLFLRPRICRVLEGCAFHRSGKRNPRTAPSCAVPGCNWRRSSRWSLGFIVAWYFYIRSPETPKHLADAASGLYQFLLNKWYFDELYDFLFVRPAKAARPVPVEEGRRLVDRRPRTGRHFGPRHRCHQPGRAPADRLPLSLCVRDADRCRRPRHLDDAREQLLMTDWPILTTVTFLPLVGALLILMIRDDSDAARRNIRNVALWTTVITFVLSLLLWIGFDNARLGFQIVEKAEWLDSGISYHMGVDGISMLFVILTTFLMPLCILASWEVDRERASRNT